MTITEPRPAATGGEPEPHVRVGIIGSGFAGLGMAIKLLERGEHDFVLFERADEVGGTWRDNHYPGCQCDVPSHLYSFSFALNPDWTRSFAPQGEIQQYLVGCADRFGVRPHIRFDHEVLDAAWDDAAQRWRITTSQGPYSADILVSGHGPLSEPAYPSIPGLDRFEGTTFHSADWHHDHDLRGERVAVIGTGASAIQFVPAIQPDVAHLDLYQRTAPWIAPRLDRAISPRTRRLLAKYPGLQKLGRAGIYWSRELMVLAFAKNEKFGAPVQKAAQAHLEAQVKDPELRRKLTPTFHIGCKRILISNDYYPSLTQPNVDVVTEGIREVRARSIVTTDGTERPIDTIIFGTGFRVTDHPIGHRIKGADGRSLAEHWEHGMSAYYGTTVSGFPNFFTMVGPNTGIGHTSMVFMMEAQYAYILDCLDAMDRGRLASVDIRPEIQQAHNDDLQSQLADTVWSSGCASWYLDAQGRNTTLWPTFTWKYRAHLRHFDIESYRVRTRRDAPVRA